MSTGIVILAAGSSSRLGQPKQNLVYQGQTLLQRIVETSLASVCHPVIVVLGANADVISATIADKPVNIIVNQNWHEGMASTIRTGIVELQQIKPGVEAAILLLCDQPFVTVQLINELVLAGSEAEMVACGYKDTIGVPALFGSKHLDELCLLTGQDGAKKILLKYPDKVITIPFPLGSVDIDTIEDFEKLNA